MSEEFQTDFTPGIVCPHCGHECRDSWEWGGGSDNDGEDECGECGEAFQWMRIVTVEYTTAKTTSDEEEDE